MMFFPWPDPRLSPNKRIDRRALVSVKQVAKESAYYITKYSDTVVLDTDLQLTLTFCPPDKRKRDLDNLYASFKAYQDGMMELLGVDDSRIDRVTLKRGAVVAEGKVIVEIKEA